MKLKDCRHRNISYYNKYFVFFIILQFFVFFGALNLKAINLDSLEKEVGKAPTNQKAILYNELAKAYQVISIKKSETFALKAIEISQKTNDKINESQGYFNLAMCYVMLHKIIDAKGSFNKSLEIREKIGDKSLISSSLNALGNVTRLAGDNKSALQYYKKALKIRKELGDKLLIGATINNIGIIYKYWGDYDKALKYYLQALKYAEEQNDPTVLMSALVNIGNVYSDLKNHKKSLEFYYRVRELAIKTGNNTELASIYNSIGTAFNAMGQYTRGIEYFTKSFQIGKTIGDINSQCYSLNNLGVAYCALKDYDKALYFYEISAKISPLNNDLYSDGTSLNNIGSIYFFKKEYKKAIPYLLQSLKINEQIENMLTLRENFQILALSYEGLNDYKNAYFYHKKYSILNDSISSEYMQKQIFDLQVKFETAKKEKEIALLKNQREVESNIRNYLFALLLLGFLLVIVMTLMFLNKSKANKELAQKNELILTQRDQLTSTLEHLNKTNQANEQYLSIITDEMTRAFNYVSSMIPEEIKKGMIKTRWMLIPSSKLGGDIFGYHWLDDKSLSIYLIDVSGHGVSGSLHAISILNSIKFQTLQNTDYHKPEQVLSALNNAYQMNEHNKLFFTIWYGVYNIETREMSFSSAGHPPAILFENNANTKFLGTRNYVIGGLRDFEYESSKTIINQNSKMYIFSDGVYEIRNKEGEMWTLEAMKDFISSQNYDENKDLDNLYEFVMNYHGSSTLDDDFSILKFTFD